MSSTRKQLARYRAKRDFKKTAEPAGSEIQRKTRKPKRRTTLAFVIQKHAARQLHFDLRLELDGVMKSWAVPKGPSLDPADKRLAMQVEDHPIEYNEFEGTIPAGEYGGGTVMIWDHGSYSAEHADEYDGDDQAALRAGLEKGDVKFILKGERLTGSFVLVRTRVERGKTQWLLIKHRDESAQRGSDVTAEFDTSVISDRTMEEIAAAAGPVWDTEGKQAGGQKRKARAKIPSKTAQRSAKTRGNGKSPAVAPMLAAVGKELPDGADWTYEPKYDGIRVLAFVTSEEVRLITRNDKDKTRQFPEVVEALEKLPGRAGRALVLDGEIVALADGEPARFQELQGRMHLENAQTIKRLSEETPAALIAFDLLVDGEDVLLDEPWSERRQRLQKRLAGKEQDSLLLGKTSTDPAAMLKDAQAHGWEGLMAKDVTAPYRPGARSRAWLKLKIEQRQEFVVGGFTEPRNSREHLGALLLGYYDDDGNFVYAGHTGGGFTRKSLAEMFSLLDPLERKTSPFSSKPKTNEKPHWVKPSVVVEIKFNEWTRDGKLRQPIFVGIRDDKDAAEVKRE